MRRQVLLDEDYQPHFPQLRGLQSHVVRASLKLHKLEKVLGRQTHRAATVHTMRDCLPFKCPGAHVRVVVRARPLGVGLFLLAAIARRRHCCAAVSLNAVA